MKGTTNNPNGRPPGKANKVTTEIRELFSNLLRANIEGMQADLEKLEPKDRLRHIIDLSKFVIPTLKSVDNIPEEKEGEDYDFKKFSSEDLKTLGGYMKNTENLISSTKAKAWFKDLMTEYYKERKGGAIVVFKTVNGIEYIHHNPYEWDFIPREEIEIINGKQFLKSSYLLPILERKYEILFKIPGNNR